MNSMRNRVSLIGKLGKDPEIKEFEQGNQMANFTMATNDYYKNNKGERVEDTQWHRIVAWGKTAGIVGKYVKKGRQVAIEGRLVHRSYEDKDGATRYITEIVAHEIVLLSPKPKEAETAA